MTPPPRMARSGCADMRLLYGGRGHFALAATPAARHNNSASFRTRFSPASPCTREDLATMWATLAVAASLSMAPAQQPAGPLKLSNDRVTNGLLGANRTETKLLPGDTFWVAFDVENPTVTKAGRVLYSMGMELTN